MSLLRSTLLLTLAFLMVGCGPRPATTTKSSDDKTVAPSKRGAAPANATSDDVLTSAVFQLRPENFGINSNPDKPVSLLNSWRFKRSEQLGAADQSTPVKAPEGWVAADDEARLAQAKFDMADSIHVRDALFYHHIAGYLSDRGRDELQRVSIVTNFVCRNVSLWKDDEAEVPLNPYMNMQLGRGSADDRAWICSEILRQLRIDSVVIRAKSDTKETSEKWVLGIVIGRKVHLFDLRLGLPLFNGSSEKGAAPAALDEIVAHPEYLEQMAANEPYRLSIDDLRDPAVFVISEPGFWCQRMHNLEQALPASDACVIYDPVIGNEGHIGLLQRVATAGGWSVESLKLWPYPKTQREVASRANDAVAQEFQRLVMPLNVPIPFETGPDGKVAFGTPERKLQRFRTDHLLGKFTESTQRYLSIRHLEVEKNPPELAPLNRRAGEDAFYWTCLCKIEMDDYAGAIDLLSAYMKKYGSKGKWYFSARTLLGQAYGEQGKLNEAISALERTSSDDPYRIENAIRVKRWNAARSK